MFYGPVHVIVIGCLQMQTKVSATLAKMWGKKKAQQHDLTETIFEKAKLFEYGTFIDIQ